MAKEKASGAFLFSSQGKIFSWIRKFIVSVTPNPGIPEILKLELSVAFLSHPYMKTLHFLEWPWKSPISNTLWSSWSLPIISFV